MHQYFRYTPYRYFWIHSERDQFSIWQLYMKNCSWHMLPLWLGNRLSPPCGLTMRPMPRYTLKFVCPSVCLSVCVLTCMREWVLCFLSLCPTCRKLGGGDLRLICRHYATLYFVFCVDTSESELGILDLIQVQLGATLVPKASVTFCTCSMNSCF